MKYLQHGLLVLLTCLSTALAAQNESDGYKEAYRLLQEKNDNLQTEIAKLQGEAKSQQDIIQKLTKENEKQQGEIDKLKQKNETLENAASKTQIKALEQQIKDLNQQIQQKEQEIEVLKQQQTEAENNKEALKQQQNQAHQQEIEDWKAKLEAANRNNQKLQQELDKLGEFRGKYLAQLAQTVDSKWLSKSYTQINLEELEEETRLYNQYARDDKQVAAAAGKLSKLLNEYNSYDRGIQAVNSPYQSETVARCTREIKALRDKTTDKTKKEELSTLYNQLESYPSMVKEFQDIIKEVDKATEEFKTHKAASPMAQEVLKEQEEYGIITAIRSIPWLKGQFEKYKKALETNCKGANEAHDTILNIHI
ncbi:MAG: hypothetical protein J1E02_06735 [Coprobacter sp.]|nr:hypothetical protein [Coprobacter sp.]